MHWWSLVKRAVLSCTNGLAAEIVEDFGLDVAADGRIFVVSPDTNQLKIVPTSSVSGVLLVNSMQTLSLGWRPTDVTVALGPVPLGGGQPKEVAVVVGTGLSNGQAMVRIYNDTANLSLITDVPGLSLGQDPVSVTIREDGAIAYVAAEGQSTVLLVDVRNGVLLPTTLPAAGLGTLRRVAVQRISP